MQSGKNIFVYQVDEIDIIKKEIIQISEEEKEYTNIENKTWSFGLGSNSKAPVPLIFTKDFRVSDNSSIYLYLASYRSGIGYSYQEEYNNNGLIFSISMGSTFLNIYSDYYPTNFYLDGEVVEECCHLINTISLAYQKKAKKRNFWSFGIMLFRGPVFDYNISGDDHYKNETLFAPVIGWDIRF